MNHSQSWKMCRLHIFLVNHLQNLGGIPNCLCFVHQFVYLCLLQVPFCWGQLRLFRFLCSSLPLNQVNVACSPCEDGRDAKRNAQPGQVRITCPLVSLLLMSHWPKKFHGQAQSQGLRVYYPPSSPNEAMTKGLDAERGKELWLINQSITCSYCYKIRRTNLEGHHLWQKLF